MGQGIGAVVGRPPSNLVLSARNHYDATVMLLSDRPGHHVRGSNSGVRTSPLDLSHCGLCGELESIRETSG